VANFASRAKPEHAHVHGEVAEGVHSGRVNADRLTLLPF
jgi:hypothetical protein